MFRSALATILTVVILFTVLGLQPVIAQTARTTQSDAKIRTKVSKLGVGPKARVEVKLRNNHKLKGYISEAGQDSFTVVDSKTGTATAVAFDDVVKVNKPGGGPSTLTLAILGAAAVTAVIVGVTVVKPVLCDGGAGC